MVATALLLVATLHLPAQGTAISYQGRLNAGGEPANTNFDFRFAVFNAPTNGAAVSLWLTNVAVPVSNGLFGVTLDFGPGVFEGTANGSNDWMDVSVRPSGTTAFTTLWPRQPILPVPYALFATSASNLLGTLSATQLSGTIASNLISGTFSNLVNFANNTNAFTGNFFGAFNGNGANLTNLNAFNISSGTLADTRLTTNVDLLNAAQTITGSKVFAGSITSLSTNIFNGSNTFNGAVTYNGTNTLNGKNIFNGTNYFMGGISSSGTNQFMGSNTFGGPVISSGTNVFYGPNTFNGPGVYNGNENVNGSNNFTGPNIFSAWGNSFTGSFFGNGLVGWTAVPGATQAAVRDHGYMATNTVLTTITLPATAGLTNGDIVRISGAGTGGWVATQNSGQSTVGNFFSYQNSVVGAVANNPTSNARGVAASADGVRMYAVGFDTQGLWTSTDSGHTWSQITTLSGYYVSVACSANGKIIYAEPTGTGAIQKSTNGGITWTSAGVSANGMFISCTSDGSQLLQGMACSGNGKYRAELYNGAIYYSNNGGTSWNAVTGPAASVGCVAVSSDCTRIVAGVTNGLLYASANQGATWTSLTTSNQAWCGAWMSPDGSMFAGTVAQSGSIYGAVYSSAVSGLPNTVTTNSIAGSQGSAVELQYIGNGQFMPVSAVGSLWAN